MLKIYFKIATRSILRHRFYTTINIFGFDLLSGDIEKALEESNSIILTQSGAQKYFGPDCCLSNFRF